jgi:hypothetical protein
MPSSKQLTSTKPDHNSSRNAATHLALGESKVTFAAVCGISTTTSRGQRRRPRIGPDLEAARQMTAQINSQFEAGAPAALSFEAIAILELRNHRLTHHEQVLRSSSASIKKYGAATEHLIRYIQNVKPVNLASHFRTSHAEGV